MILQIDHIGVAVNNMDEAVQLFNNLLDTEAFHREHLPQQGLTAIFYKLGPTKIELLIPDNENSPVGKFLAKKGPGIHHVAYLTDDINKEMERMKSSGFKPLSEQAYKGALNKMVCFFHPKDTGGVLTELCQNP